MNRNRSGRLRILLAFSAYATLLPAGTAWTQVTVSGHVRTFAGDPIAGATVRLVTLGQTRTTDAAGFYDFGSPAALGPETGHANYALTAGGGRLHLNLDRGKRVSLEILELHGRRVMTLAEGLLPAGAHGFPLPPEAGSGRMLLLKARVGSETALYKLALGGFAALSPQGATRAEPMGKRAAAPDSLHVTHPAYDGGLVGLHARRVAATTGVQNFRLYSTDAGWDIAAPQITFSISSDAGGNRFKQLVPDYQNDVRKVLKEVIQSIWRTPAEIPSNKRHTSYRINISGCSGVASAGGTTIDFCSGHIANQADNRAGWLEVMGVLIHESVHTYQPYYNTSGASGFGEAVPDAIRALTGYFSWHRAGSRCSGGYQAAYQGGGRYWLYIEYKHPGFINKIYRNNTGSIESRVQTITGQTLGSLASECETAGMPPGSG